MAYVDGFVIPVPKHKLDAYRALAEKAGPIWREYGALRLCEPAVLVKCGLPQAVHT